jgi:hypothetical protein
MQALSMSQGVHMISIGPGEAYCLPRAVRCNIGSLSTPGAGDRLTQISTLQSAIKDTKLFQFRNNPGRSPRFTGPFRTRVTWPAASFSQTRTSPESNRQARWQRWALERLQFEIRTVVYMASCGGDRWKMLATYQESAPDVAVANDTVEPIPGSQAHHIRTRRAFEDVSSLSPHGFCLQGLLRLT